MIVISDCVKEIKYKKDGKEVLETVEIYSFSITQNDMLGVLLLGDEVETTKWRGNIIELNGKALYEPVSSGYPGNTRKMPIKINSEDLD